MHKFKGKWWEKPFIFHIKVEMWQLFQFLFLCETRFRLRMGIDIYSHGNKKSAVSFLETADF